MKSMIAAATLAASCLAIAQPAAAQTSAPRYGTQAQDEEARFAAARDRFDREYEAFQAALDRYQRYRATPPRWDDRGPPPPPRGYESGSGPDDRYEGDYDPARYYRPGPERVLGPDDRVYRGQDGKYYCQRSDGTTGLIVGAAAGGLFGNIIANRHSRTVGTLLGAIAGGALGSAADRNQVRCR